VTGSQTSAPGAVAHGAFETTLVNGIRASGISPADRGLHYGDGVFETIACRAARPRFLSLHLDRLALGCSRLKIGAPDLEALRAEVRSLAQDQDRAIIKVLVTRGIARARGYRAEGNETATRITFRYAWPQDDVASYQQGVKV
jgi:4-amino-4-deoxychorismate lyase